MASRIAVSASLILALLALNLFTAIPYLNWNLVFREAYAQPVIELRIPSLSIEWTAAADKIFYIQASNGLTGPIFVRADGSQLSVVRTGHLPPGISVVSAGSDQLLVHVPKLEIPEGELPVSYSITFTATRVTTAGEETTEASIILVLEPRVRAIPTLTFDKSVYSRGERAIVTLTDTRRGCSTGSFDLTNVPVQISLPGAASFTVQLSRDLRDPAGLNELWGTFLIPAGASGGEIRASTENVGIPTCVFPALTLPSGAISAKASIAPAAITFDKTIYSAVNASGQSDIIRLRVVDDDFANDTLQATLNVIVEHEADVLEPLAAQIHTLDRVPTTNVFIRELQAAQLFSSFDFNQGKARVNATYDDVGPMDPIASATIYSQAELSFDENRLSYTSDELATLRLVNPERNTNPADFDSLFVTVCSYYLNNTFVDGGTSFIPLSETGRDTGEFGSLYYLTFVNATFNAGSIPEESERAIFDQSVIRVPEDRNAKIIAKLDSSDCDPVLPTADTSVPVATLEPATFIEFDDPARGEVSGARAHNSPPLVTATAINCVANNYGGDTDKDGICDNWEPGGSALAIYYPAGSSLPHEFSYTCDPCPSKNHKDVFVEIDFVNNANAPACPSPDNKSWRPDTTLPDSAIQNVIDAFNEGRVSNPGSPHSPTTGVKMHIYVDEDVAPSCLLEVDVWRELTADGVDDSFDEIKQTFFGDGAAERASTNKGKAKWQVFHYGVFIPKQAQDPSSSGVAEPIGNDFVVSLGVGGVFVNNYAHQQGTLMHELGHNLGLHHGGYNITSPYVNDYNVNCKPNYVSVMSYMRQITNPYSNASLLYSEDEFATDDNDNSVQAPSNAIYWNDPDEDNVISLSTSSWYSTVELIWGKSGTIPPAVDIYAYNLAGMQDVNWNNWGGISDGGTNANILDTGVTGCGTDVGDSIVFGANDWANLQYDFRTKNTPAFATGFHSGEPENYPIEVNSTIATQIFLEGIEMLNIMVQNLTENSVDFSDGEAILFDHGPEPGNEYNLTQAKGHFDAKLVSNTDSVYNLINKTLDESTILAGNNTEYLRKATFELLELRRLLDDADGGDPDDDKIHPNENVTAILRFMDDNIAALKVALGEIAMIPGGFPILSYDRDCTDFPGAPMDSCVIIGRSDSITSVAESFRIEEDKKRISIDLVGQGPLWLEFPDDLLPSDPAKIYHVISNDGGRRLDFKVVNQTSAVIYSLPFYPRSVALFYGPDLVPPSDLELAPSRAYVGWQNTIGFSLTNFVEFYQPYTALIEVRHDNGTTAFVGWQTGILKPDPHGENTLEMSWTPQVAGEYQLRVFVINGFDRPEVLSEVKTLNFDVKESIPDPQFSSDTHYDVGDTVTVLITDEFSNKNDGAEDEIVEIRVYSTSDIVGQEFNVEETADNTSNFDLRFRLSASTDLDAIAVKDGDTVTISFEDERGEEFTHTILVGSPSAPSTNSTGGPSGNSTIMR